MNHRERLLTALAGGKPDRLPATIHGWMDYWREKYMDGADQLEIYRHFDMDAQIFYFAWLTGSTRALSLQNSLFTQEPFMHPRPPAPFLPKHTGRLHHSLARVPPAPRIPEDWPDWPGS